MSWKDAYRLSDVGFAELSLQAVYAFRHGNVAPPGSPREIVARARRRVFQSKAVIALVLGLLSIGATLLLRSGPPAVYTATLPLPEGAFRAGVLTALFSLDIAFLWWTGMQVLPTFLASGVLPVLEALPIDERTMTRTAALLYLRLFDLPAAVVIVVTPVALGLAFGPWVGFAALPGVVTAVGFALALSLLTGRFFVVRVQGSRSGGGRTWVRWGYLTLWLLPAFAMFGFVTAAPAFFRLLEGIAQNGPSPVGHLLLAAFPFPLAVLPAVAASGPAGLGLDLGGWLILAAALVGYVSLAGVASVWVLASVRRVGLIAPAVARPSAGVRLGLRPGGAAWAVLVKDLRIASRTPGYAFLILLPVLDSLALGLLTVADAQSASAAFDLGLATVVTSALLATFFGPAFFAIEVIAYSYGRTLPLSDRSLLAGKVVLVAFMYLAASTIVLALTLLRFDDPAIFFAFVAAELPGVLAAATLELGIVFRRARSRGLPITNMYAGAWYALLVSIPGLVVAIVPLVAFQADRAAGTTPGLAAMALVALAELAVCLPWSLGRGAN